MRNEERVGNWYPQMCRKQTSAFVYTHYPSSRITKVDLFLLILPFCFPPAASAGILPAAGVKQEHSGRKESGDLSFSPVCALHKLENMDKSYSFSFISVSFPVKETKSHQPPRVAEGPYRVSCGLGGACATPQHGSCLHSAGHREVAWHVPGHCPFLS